MKQLAQYLDKPQYGLAASLYVPTNTWFIPQFSTIYQKKKKNLPPCPTSSEKRMLTIFFSLALCPDGKYTLPLLK